MADPVQRNFRINMQRKDGHDLSIGKFVHYDFGNQTGITASRVGVILKFQMPWIPSEGIHVLKSVMDRARIHHEHLASYQPGDVQEPLDEATVAQRASEVTEHRMNTTITERPRVVTPDLALEPTKH